MVGRLACALGFHQASSPAPGVALSRLCSRRDCRGYWTTSSQRRSAIVRLVRAVLALAAIVAYAITGSGPAIVAAFGLAIVLAPTALRFAGVA